MGTALSSSLVGTSLQGSGHEDNRDEEVTWPFRLPAPFRWSRCMQLRHAAKA